jgi:hypothetical protein
VRGTATGRMDGGILTDAAGGVNPPKPAEAGERIAAWGWGAPLPLRGLEGTGAQAPERCGVRAVGRGTGAALTTAARALPA